MAAFIPDPVENIKGTSAAEGVAAGASIVLVSSELPEVMVLAAIDPALLGSEHSFRHAADVLTVLTQMKPSQLA